MFNMCNFLRLNYARLKLAADDDKRKTLAVVRGKSDPLSIHILRVLVDIYRARQLYKNISMLFLFPVKDGKASMQVATFDASCYG